MSSNAPAGSLFVVVCRVFWLMLGPMILLLAGLKIIGDGDGWFAPKSVFYLAVVPLLPLARWIEFRRGGATTSMGLPATATDVRRYMAIALVAGLGAWAVANLIGNQALPQSRINDHVRSERS